MSTTTQSRPPIALNLKSIFCSLGLTLLATSDLRPIKAQDGMGGAWAVIDSLLRAWAHVDQALVIVLIWVYVAILLTMYFEQTKRHAWLVLPALFFGFANVCGFALQETNELAILFSTPLQAFKTSAAFLSSIFIAFATGNVLFNVLDARLDARAHTPGRTIYKAPRFAQRIFDKHPFAAPALFLAIVWLPVCIGYAPGLFMGDTINQVCMWFGIDNEIARTVVRPDPSITMTNHYPIAHTAFLGLCLQCGLGLWGSANAGVLLYSTLQVCTTIFCIAYAHYLVTTRLNAPFLPRILCLLFIGLVPWYGGYAMLITRDTLFADGLLVFGISLIVLYKTPGSKLNWVLCAVAACMVALFRPGGIVFVAMGCIAYALCTRQSVRADKPCTSALACLGVSAALVCTLTFAVLPIMRIAPGNVIEILSIPVQQTAYYVQKHEGDITSEEKDAIDAVLVYENLAQRYDPNVSDPVKDYAAQNRTIADFNDWTRYFAAWARMGAKDPACYALATMNNYYGYFYPSKYIPYYYNYEWSVQCMNDTRALTGVDIHHPDNAWVKALASFNTAYAELFQRTYVLRLTMMPSFWMWVLIVLTAYAIHRRWRYAIPVLVCAWTLALVCLIGPCNAISYNRYIYPLALLLPFALPALWTAESTTEACEHTEGIARGRHARE